jgi:hypothetical protein
VAIVISGFGNQRGRGRIDHRPRTGVTGFAVDAGRGFPDRSSIDAGA